VKDGIFNFDTDSAKFNTHYNNNNSTSPPPFPLFNVVCIVLDVQGVTQHWKGEGGGGGKGSSKREIVHKMRKM
jgi:hypothetical protein